MSLKHVIVSLLALAELPGLSSVELMFLHVIFTALLIMQTRYSEENSVCLSVRPSVCHTRDP